jgi:GrpB-like predicted nucleotidyltransferase (UPF0157 family)
MQPVPLKPVSEYAPVVERMLGLVCPQLCALLPDAEVHHIGATSVPRCVTKGDVDLLLRVRPSCFPATVELLKSHFAIKQPENWTPEFASFGDDTSHELPLGVQVVVRESNTDYLLFLRDYLCCHEEALREYNRLKMAHAVEGPEGYWRAKNQFFEKLLALRDAGEHRSLRTPDPGSGSP